MLLSKLKEAKTTLSKAIAVKLCSTGINFYLKVAGRHLQAGILYFKLDLLDIQQHITGKIPKKPS